MERNHSLNVVGAQRMTSLEIAGLTGKQHKDVLKAIRNMESAWEKECGRNFALTSQTVIQPKGGTRQVPCYNLTKTETLYIATKFNDEARARLVLRWQELEMGRVKSERVKSERCTMQNSEVKMLVTERELLMQGDAVRRGLIAEENADADGCYAASDVARMMGLTVKELNKRLVAEGVQFWNGGRYKLTREYEGMGLAKDRSFHYYGLDGEKKERKYLVWTEKGVELVKEIINS